MSTLGFLHPEIHADLLRIPEPASAEVSCSPLIYLDLLAKMHWSIHFLILRGDRPIAFGSQTAESN